MPALAKPLVAWPYDDAERAEKLPLLCELATDYEPQQLGYICGLRGLPRPGPFPAEAARDKLVHIAAAVMDPHTRRLRSPEQPPAHRLDARQARTGPGWLRGTTICSRRRLHPGGGGVSEGLLYFFDRRCSQRSAPRRDAPPPASCYWIAWDRPAPRPSSEPLAPGVSRGDGLVDGAAGRRRALGRGVEQPPFGAAGLRVKAPHLGLADNRREPMRPAGGCTSPAHCCPPWRRSHVEKSVHAGTGMRPFSGWDPQARLGVLMADSARA